jgi:LysR family nitrogen assimilation transcriptional regulator
MNLTLRQLSYFVATVNAGNMTRAAERLHLAPPALSMQVKAMEEAMGVRLLTRHSRGVTPTPPGRLLYDRAEEILAIVEQTEAMVGRLADHNRQRLRIGLEPGALHCLGADAMNAARVHLRDIELYLRTGSHEDLVKGLDARSIDLLFVSEPTEQPNTETLELVEESLVLAAAPGGALGSMPFSRVLSSELLFYAEGCVCHRAVEERARHLGLQLERPHFVGSLDLIRQMVARGQGLAVLPASVVYQEVEHGEIGVHEIDGPPILRRLSLAWHRDRAAEEPLARAIQFAIEYIGNAYVRAIPNARRLARA